MTSGVMKCAHCGETFGCDGPSRPGPVYCSEECEIEHQGPDWDPGEDPEDYTGPLLRGPMVGPADE